MHVYRILVLLMCSLAFVACSDDDGSTETEDVSDTGPDFLTDTDDPNNNERDTGVEDTGEEDTGEDDTGEDDTGTDTRPDDTGMSDTGMADTSTDTDQGDADTGGADTDTDVATGCVEDDKGFLVDTVAASTALTSSTDFAADYADLFICTLDTNALYNDWYAFETGDAGTYDFTVTYEDDGTCLDVFVYTDLSDDGFLDGSPDLTGGGSNTASLDLEASTLYYVQILSLDGSGAAGCSDAFDGATAGPYGFSVAGGEACIDDTVGVPTLPSDTITALSLNSTVSDLAICGSNQEDYFELTLAAETEVTVTVDHSNLNAFLDIYIYDRPDTAEDFIVDYAYANNGTGTNTLTTTLAAGTWYVNIYSNAGASPYTLSLSADVPECDPACENAGVCVDTNTCDCTDTGYTDATCSTEITCTPVCANGGSCVGIDTCDCTDTGYVGDSCETEITCTPVCANNGLCIAIDTCNCADTGFTGPTCEMEIVCDPACANGGACVDTNTCDCVGTGFFGDTCEDAAPDLWINELHYDNDGGDVEEGIEIAGTAGADLAGWTLVLYNGRGRTVYYTGDLSGTIPNENAGYGALWFPTLNLQNGDPDGAALVDGAGVVVEFISYEGSFSAADGPAAGIMSTDIGVAESSATPEGHSLQRVGNGAAAIDFTWQEPAAHSRGLINVGQTIP